MGNDTINVDKWINVSEINETYMRTIAVKYSGAEYRLLFLDERMQRTVRFEMCQRVQTLTDLLLSSERIS